MRSAARLCGPDVHAAAMWLELGELATAVLGCTWTSPKEQLDVLRDCDPAAHYPTRLWLWMHARGTPLKPPQLRKALALSNDETDALKQLRRFHDLPDLWPTLSAAARKRRLAEPGCAQAFLAWDAGTVSAETARALQAEAERLAADGIGLAPEPFVTGGDLIAQGLAPGPDFKRRLDAAYDAQLEGGAVNKDQALAIALQ